MNSLQRIPTCNSYFASKILLFGASAPMNPMFMQFSTSVKPLFYTFYRQFTCDTCRDFLLYNFWSACCIFWILTWSFKTHLNSLPKLQLINRLSFSRALFYKLLCNNTYIAKHFCLQIVLPSLCLVPWKLRLLFTLYLLSLSDLKIVA